MNIFKIKCYRIIKANVLFRELLSCVCCSRAQVVVICCYFRKAILLTSSKCLDLMWSWRWQHVDSPMPIFSILCCLSKVSEILLICCFRHCQEWKWINLIQHRIAVQWYVFMERNTSFFVGPDAEFWAGYWLSILIKLNILHWSLVTSSFWI